MRDPHLAFLHNGPSRAGRTRQRMHCIADVRQGGARDMDMRGLHRYDTAICRND